MFVPVFESLQKMTGVAVETQQEMFKRWLSLWPSIPAVGNGASALGEQVQKFQKRWAEAVGELIRRQQETIDAQFKAGQQSIDKAFEVGEARTAEEMRARAVELWKKCIEAVVRVPEAQLRECQVAVKKCLDAVAPPVPTA